jgi:hypothetical protein
MEQDVKVLTKLLNSELFLGKYPMIKYVSVEEYGKGIDIVLILNSTKKYYPISDEIKNYILKISKFASVRTSLNIYP